MADSKEAQFQQDIIDAPGRPKAGLVATAALRPVVPRCIPKLLGTSGGAWPQPVAARWAWSRQ